MGTWLAPFARHGFPVNYKIFKVLCRRFLEVFEIGIEEKRVDPPEFFPDALGAKLFQCENSLLFSS